MKTLPLLRISLTVVIAALVAILAIVHMSVHPRIRTLSKERDAFKSSVELNMARANTAESHARELSEQVAEVNAKSELTLQESKHTMAENARLLINLEEARATLHSAKQELARWSATGATAEQVASLARKNKALATQVSQLQANYDRLSHDHARAKRILDMTLDPNAVPELPPMHGSVLVVDPKWNFVVLDLGESHGLVKNGVLTISRDGKLIGKAKVRRVETGRSIADLLPGWSLAEVREGDQVMN